MRMNVEDNISAKAVDSWMKTGVDRVVFCDVNQWRKVYFRAL